MIGAIGKISRAQMMGKSKSKTKRVVSFQTKEREDVMTNIKIEIKDDTTATRMGNRNQANR